MIDEPHFSISLGKIPQPNIRTDPELQEPIGEDNVITDTATYKKVKNYIYAQQHYLQKDTAGLNYNSKLGSYKIVIDYKQVYYLKWDHSDIFFTGLYAYLRKEYADERVIAQMNKDLFR